MFMVLLSSGINYRPDKVFGPAPRCGMNEQGFEQ